MKLNFWKPKRRVEVVKRDPLKLRLHDWQSDEKLVQGAAQVLSGDYMRMMMDVLRNEHPAFIVLNPDVRLDARAAFQMRCEGYTMALANLEALGLFKRPAEVLESSFEPEQ